MSHSTIAAISTPKGLGALSVIRLSGEGTVGIARILFPTLPETIKPWKMYHAHAIDPTTGIPFEEVLLCCMLSPHSYTGEDMLEIYGHGGWIAPQVMLQHLLSLGAVHAQPGEFTRRALDHGKIDLVQAEYVHQMAKAKCQKELELSIKNIQGHLSNEITNLSNEMREYMVWAEAVLSYPEQIDEERDLQPLLKRWTLKSEWLMDQYHKTRKFEDGFHVVIAGKTNVGKSSLFNLLAERDRSLVSPYASTTHDYVLEQVLWEGQSLYLYDTAGWTPHPGPIDQLCLEQTQKIADKSSLLLVVADLSDTSSMDEAYICNIVVTYPYKTWLVLNKSDLNESIPTSLSSAIPSHIPVFIVSSISKEGIEQLKASIVQQINHCSPDDWALHISERWYDALCNVNEKLHQLELFENPDLYLDMIMSELKQIQLLLNEQLGYNLNQELHNEIFQKFCIGK